MLALADETPARPRRPGITLPPGVAALPIVACAEITCGRSFQARTTDQKFCCPSCKSKHHQRRRTREAAAYEALIAFADRKKRGIGMTDLSRLVRSWTEEDEALKRKAAERRAAKGIA